MTAPRVCRLAALASAVLALALGWSSPAWAAAVVTTAFGSNQVVIYPTPNAGLPNPEPVVVPLPAGAQPRGLSCFAPDTCLVADVGHARVFVVKVSTATVVETISTLAVGSLMSGPLAVNPAATFALGVDPFALFGGQLTVIAAPFVEGATVTSVPLAGSVSGGTQSIVFAPAGRAFVCNGNNIAVVDPPYAAVAFTMAPPAGTSCSELAITADGQTLLAPDAKNVNIFTAPFSAASTAEVLVLPDAQGLGGAAVTAGDARALVVDVSGTAVWAVAAPFSSASAVERIALPPGLPTLRQIAVSPDTELAVVTGGGGNDPHLAFVRAPFTAAGATAFDVFIDGGIGLGGAAFLGNAGPPGPPPAPCGPITVATPIAVGGARLAAEDEEPVPVPLLAALLPLSRSVRVGCPATAFVSVINAGTEPAADVGISLTTSIPADFLYQTTDPATNALTGTPNTPADIAPLAVQTYLVALTPRAPIAPTEVVFRFAGANTAPLTPIPGLNTLALSASTDPVPDIVALGAVAGNTGIVDVPAATNTGAFAVASVNVGLGASLTVSGDTGGAVLPVTIQVCPTNILGLCTVPPAGSVTAFIDGGATPTFAFFVAAQGFVPFDPAVNRVFARFKDAGGVTRGSTSVAVRSTP